MKIILVCSAGMSTSMLVNKMKESAKERDISVEIDALAESQLKDHLDNLDVVLIGPQVRFLEKKVCNSRETKRIKVNINNEIAYEIMKDDKVLNQAINLKNE